MATPVSDWQTSHELTLPSGNVARLKRVALIDLILQGGIPDTLSSRAVEMAGQTQQRKLTVQELRDYEAVVNLVVKAAMIEPEISDQGLAISDIDFIDRVQIFNWANGGVHNLRPFRNKPAGETRPFDAS